MQILDHGVWDDMPFIAMELLEGEDLDVRLRRVGRLYPRDTAVIVGQVARALAKAHAAGLVHRDLKPANIFLVQDEDREIVKVLDFGIAKRTQLAVGDAHTKTGAIMGSPHFMSPEQARGLREVDHRTDLWALGVITFRCVVGRLPFQSDSLGDLFAKIITDPIPVPSQLLGPGGVPPGFDAWWARSSARDADQRFQSAKDLADALSLALGVSLASTSSVDLRPPPGLPPPPAAMAATGPTPLTPGPISAPGAHGTLLITPGKTPAPGFSPQTAGAVASEVPARPSAPGSCPSPRPWWARWRWAARASSRCAEAAGDRRRRRPRRPRPPTPSPRSPRRPRPPPSPPPRPLPARAPRPPSCRRPRRAAPRRPALPQTAHPSPAPPSTTRTKVTKPVHDDGI